MGGSFGKGDASKACITETKLETKMVEAMQRRASKGSSMKSFNSIILKFPKIDESLRKCKDIFKQFGRFSKLPLVFFFSSEKGIFGSNR